MSDRLGAVVHAQERGRFTALECEAVEHFDGAFGVNRVVDLDYQSFASEFVEDVVRILDRLAAERSMAPGLVPFGNGPEFSAHAVALWGRFDGTATILSVPRSPWQHAWIESFNGRLRHEFLNGCHFDILLEARVLIED